MKLKILDFKELKSFPSGSGIECYEEKIYLAGDDSRDVLVMDKKWKKLTTIPLSESGESRIPKKVKSDFEATTIVEINKIPRLFILGSGSKDKRNKAVLVNLDDYTKEVFEVPVFYERLKTVLSAINIESASVVLDKLLLGNRGNKNSPDNQLVVTDMDFWRHQDVAQTTVTKIDLPGKPKEPIGLSGMDYSHLNDWLLVTLSTEITSKSGEKLIGDSYLAIVENASRKIHYKKMKANELINLSEVDKSFRGHKIESVCIQSEKSGRLKLQLVADDDDGKSYLFKVRLKG